MAHPRTLIFPLLALAAGCKPDNEFIQQDRCLTTAPLVDAGLVAVMDRETVSIQLRSECNAPVSVTDIRIENTTDDDAFYLLTWQDESGTGLTIDGGSEDVPGIGMAQVSFRPNAAGYFRALMTITSNDTVTEGGIWKVALRGMAQYPCGTLAPVVIDYGRKAMGGYFPGYVNVQNCGQVTLTVAAFEVEGSSSFYVSTPDPVYIPPIPEPTTVEIGWIPGATTAQSATITFVTNDPNLDGEVAVTGNNCATSVESSWDQDNDGWFGDGGSCGGDCNDSDPTINPSATEKQNGVDDDCDGSVDESANNVTKDNDGDGFSEEQGDCDDNEKAIYPGAAETINQVDDDCDGAVDDQTWYYDDDDDGYSERAGDCNDGSATVYPGATENPTDGIDNDCDGDTDEGGMDFDDDGDGYTDNGGDCNDGDPWTYPAAPEDCDSIDNDCDALIDEDDACAYLSERNIDTGAAVVDTSNKSTCSTVSRRGLPGLLVGLLASLLVVRRRRDRAV